MGKSTFPLAFRLSKNTKYKLSPCVSPLYLLFSHRVDRWLMDRAGNMPPLATQAITKPLVETPNAWRIIMGADKAKNRKKKVDNQKQSNGHAASPKQKQELPVEDQISFEDSHGEKTTVEASVTKPSIEDIFEEHVSFLDIALIYLCYGIILVCGYGREWTEKLLIRFGFIKGFVPNKKGYAPLFKPLDIFWLRRNYQRIRDLFERPISTKPGAYIDVMIRESDDGNATYKFTGENRTCFNLCSYNYLGFAENDGPVIDSVEDSIRRLSFATGSPRLEAGNHVVVDELEKLVAHYIGKPAALVVGMGYATNSTVLPALASGRGNLIISDTLNHASIVCGSRDSGATIRVFKHNDAHDLEGVLRGSILEGQPRTRIPWKRIFVVVEGVYSMEGEILKLPEILAVTKRYKAYLYVDEAHSIGALGKTGRGVCEHWGVDPSNVDILMGTFTKAFGSVGGYIASSEEVIRYLKSLSYGSVYATSMSPPCAQQALSALKLIAGLDGTEQGQVRLNSLHDNSNYFRARLTKMGFHVIGDDDSPIVPMMVYHPSKMCFLSRELLKRGITIVVVGFPVTTLMLSRIRFCISAAHSREDLDWALEQINELGVRCKLNYGLKDHTRRQITASDVTSKRNINKVN
ncbi:hypothetical protein PROFUN_10896 [Planoprotostelium fungivorum]|uniref:serine C-palmitoyltransferase n=1 Tax=Planoprotostelium fungivorum TaxID=1890364 RepID=A0A2P6NC41_9EUKA|nr:hypothetical protein PROFUN_10896 [Planoprotostelium fungivorum]